MIEFEIIGLPAPQGSKSAVMVGGKARIIEGKSGGQRAKHTSWRDSITAAARVAAEPLTAPLAGPLHVDVTFRMPRPASRGKKHHGWHSVAPDKDKLLRSLFDGLQVGGLVANDSQFCSMNVRALEVDGWSGAAVSVWELKGVAHG